MSSIFARRLIQPIASLALWLAIAPSISIAQTTTSLLPDANVLPSREIRARFLVDFTRWDQLLGNGGRRNLGSIAEFDSIGAAQMPFLSPIEENIRSASAMPAFRLSAGNIVSPANSRIATAPLILEYGVTNRLTLGLVVPFVQTRSTLVAQLNPRSVNPSQANVGPNPAALGNATALGQNLAVVQGLRTASGSLASALSTCTSDPSGAGCTTLLGQQASIEALLQNANGLATTIETLYGTDPTAHPGQSFVPLNDNVIQLAIDQRVESLASQLGGFLGTDVAVGRVAAANGPAARYELQQILHSFGRDSIGPTDRTSLGDISLGASFQLLNTFGDTGTATFFKPQLRLTVNGTFRIGTGQPAASNRLFDVGTGYGQHGIEGGVATDLRFGNHISGSAIASYTHQLGTIDVARVPNAAYLLFPLDAPYSGTYSAGDVMRFSAIPRLRLGGYFAFTGNYTLIHTGGDKYSIAVAPSTIAVPPTAPFGYSSSTAQQIGLGFLYSTIVGPARHPGGIPWEVSFEHLETIAGSGGPVNKMFVDRLQLKIYYSTRRRASGRK